MTGKPPSLTAPVCRWIAAGIVVVIVGAATISAQFAVFDEGFEGEIWELIATLQMPGAVDSYGNPRADANWAAGIAWVNGELFVADNYTSVITKFDETLQQVSLPGADWYGAYGSPTVGWTPNEAIAADVIVNGAEPRQALVVTDSSSSRVFAFWPDGGHIFTLVIPEQAGDPAYTASLNGIAVTAGGRFELTNVAGSTPTLRVAGKLAVAWPEYFDLASGGALIYDNSNFVYDAANGQFAAGEPDTVLTGGEDETGDPDVPAVKAVTGVTFDSAGNFYMVDSWTGRLHGYNSGLEHQFVFGTPDATGETTEEFEEAYGMTLWPSEAGDRLLITLPWKNRAVVYAPSPRQGVPGTVDYLFKLDGLGAVDGLPHSSAFDRKTGRVAVSDSGDNSVKIFQTPALAVFNLQVKNTAGQPVLSVCGGDHYSVSFSLTVPEDRNTLQMVTPRLLVNGVETSVVAAPADSYGASGVGPLAPRDVISYSYSFTAPNIALPQTLAFEATATAFTLATGAAGVAGEVTDIFEKFGDLAVIDCGSDNVAPTIAALTPLPPASNGWTRIAPLPAPVNFTVTLAATDADGSISRITYSASGTNSVPSTTVVNQPTVPIALLQPGVTTITYQAFDDDLRPSLPGTLTVRLDNSLPSICLNIPAPHVTKPDGEGWWKNTVTIPVVLTDNQDPSPRIVAPIPANYLNGSLVFAGEGAAQFVTLVAEDHAGHQRVQPSNTTLDVCGPGKAGRLINIDKTAPTVSEDGNEAAIHPAPITVTISAQDALSKVRYIEYSLNDGPFVQFEAASAAVAISATSSLRFRAIDWAGNASAVETRTYTINTSGNAAPVCTAAYTTADMWPPNHKQVYVTVAGVTDPDRQPVTIRLTSIVQDEPTNTVGQGNTIQDGGIEQGGARAWVRSERSGTPKVPGDGRVYLIGFAATDSLGASCNGTVRLDVPHDQRGTPAVLSPGRWNSLTGQRVP